MQRRTKRPTTKPNYYQVLNVRRDATPIQIHRAYRSLALSHHPDVHSVRPGSPDMALVNEAYQCLSHIRSRLRYDRILSVPEPPELQRATLDAAEAMLVGRGWQRKKLEDVIVMTQSSRRVATQSTPILEPSELEQWTGSALNLVRRKLVECAVLIAYRVLIVDEVEHRITDLGYPLTVIDLVHSKALGMGFLDAAYEELFEPLLVRSG